VDFSGISTLGLREREMKLYFLALRLGKSEEYELSEEYGRPTVQASRERVGYPIVQVKPV
jgi:hypothetical protein